MSSKALSQSDNSSASSFVDATDASDTLNTVIIEDRDTLKEEPLSTPNHSNIQTNAVNNDVLDELEEEKETNSNIVTIFDVATEIENMLNDISLKIEENDKVVQQKIEKINKSLDKIESKVKPNK